MNSVLHSFLQTDERVEMILW